MCSVHSQALGACVHTKSTQNFFFLSTVPQQIEYDKHAYNTYCAFWLISDLDMVEGHGRQAWWSRPRTPVAEREESQTAVTPAWATE